MSRALQQMIMIKASIMVNTFLYYFKRLWVIGKYVPDRVYGNRELKQVLAVLFTVVGQMINLSGKAAYILIFAVFPVIMTGRKGEIGFDCTVQILFFLSGIMGPLQESMIFQVTKEKLTCIRYMKMSVEQYIKVYFLYHYIPFAVYFLICILIASWMVSGSVAGGLCLWMVLMMMRVGGEAFQLWLYDKKGVVFSRKYSWVWLIIFLSLAGAYSFIVMKNPFVTADRLLHPGFMGMISILGIISGWYIIKYKDYEKKVRRTVEDKWLLSSIVKESEQSADEKTVGIREKDLNTGTSRMEKIEKLHGYAYFNELFFLRHKRQIYKMMYFRIAEIGVSFLCVVVLRVFVPEAAYLVGKNIPDFMPVLVFIMYMMTVADKVCKAMFYNCDKSMLRFGFYRNPKTILSNFRIRLIKIGQYNLFIGCMLCAAVIVFRCICGIWEFGGEMILFCLAVLMLSIFFTVHHLFLYYVFQPYSEEMNVKNPFFKGINFAVYMICFFCYRVQTGGLLFIGGVLAVTMLYITVALVLVYRYAPKMFRVK